MADPNKKRITIYLDLNIEEDNAIWNYFLNRRKNEIIRPLLYNYVNGIQPQIIEKQDNSIDMDDLDFLEDFIK